MPRPAGSLLQGRARHVTVALGGGQLLVVGGPALVGLLIVALHRRRAARRD